MAKKPRQSIAPSVNTPIDFKVDPNTGIGYISQRKTAELLGLPLTTLNRFVKNFGTPSELNENNQLSEDLLIKAAKFAFSRNTPQSALVLDKLLKAGARAFIYTQAGYNPLAPTEERYTPQWFKARAEGVVARREETDVIKLFVEYARSQGSSSPDKYYMALTKMQNTALFVVEGDKPKNLRDVLNWKQLSAVKTSDLVVAKAVAEGIAAGLPYKEVFQLAKKRVEVLAVAVGKETIVMAALECLTPKAKRLKAAKPMVR